MGDEFRQHARIRAGDEERVGLLALLRQLAEKVQVMAELVGAELVDAFDKSLHRKLLREGFVFRARFGGEFLLERRKRLWQTLVADREDLHREQTGIARRADADRGHRHAGRHLHDGQQRVETFERFAFNRHADDRQRAERRRHARPRQPCTGIAK